MEAVAAPRSYVAVRAEPLLAAFVCAAASLALVVLTGPTGDAPAHLYRTMLVREGVFLWDFLWYGGHYALASYSPLYYLPAAVLGNVPVVVGACVASASLFAAVAISEWGDAARWASRAFALAAAGPVFTGTYAYAVALATLLLTLRALQLRRRVLAVVAAVLTLGASPLAFVFLLVVLAAVVVGRRGFDVRVAVALAVLAGAQLAVNRLFAADAAYPFQAHELAFVLIACALGAALARSQPLLRAFFLVWAVAALAAFVVSSPFGENLTRPRYVLFPLMLLTAAAVQFRPRVLAAAAVTAGALYNVGPYVPAAVRHAGDRGGDEAFWAPALAFLDEHATPAHRVEVVPTYDHWEAYYVPRAGFALARGWYRQFDIARNPVLYEEPLTAAEYRAWLRREAVRYVLLPETRLGAMVEEREADLLRDGALPEVARLRGWRVFEVPRATSIVEGGRVERLDHDRLVFSVPRAGTYRLRVRWTPYYTGACVTHGDDATTIVRAERPGSFTLRASVGARSTC